jgi:hypothetical protein
MSYHNGSIWPHDKSFIVLGLSRYGFRQHVDKIFEAMLASASYMELRRPVAQAALARGCWAHAETSRSFSMSRGAQCELRRGDRLGNVASIQIGDLSERQGRDRSAPVLRVKFCKGGHG